MTITADVDTRVKELRGHLAGKAKEIEDLSNSWKEEQPGKFVVSGDQHKKYLKSVSEAQEIKALIDAAEGSKGIFEYLNAPEGTSAAADDAARTRTGLSQVEMKSLATAWLESDEFKTMKANDFRQVGQIFNIERGIPDLAYAAQKDVFSAMAGTVSIPALGQAQVLPFTERTLRPGRVRDLFPAERTNAAMLYGIRETGYTNRAKVVPERTAADGSYPPTGGASDVYGLKPKSDLTIVPKSYPLATIAHIMYVHKQTLEDEPRMRGILDRDMIDGVKMAEDDQILWGDGVEPNLTGLMNTDGIQMYPGQTSDRKSAQIRRAATRAILAYFQPTGVVMHPFDWEEIELETDANGQYTVAVSVAVGGEKRVWRLNVVDSPAMQQGKGLVGAFGTGAKLYDRESVNIQISTENRDLFERNAYTLRAEERLGLVVDRPESFVVVNFADFVAP